MCPICPAPVSTGTTINFGPVQTTEAVEFVTRDRYSALLDASKKLAEAMDKIDRVRNSALEVWRAFLKEQGVE